MKAGDTRFERASIHALYGGIALGTALLFFLLMASMADYYNYNTAPRDEALLAPIAAHAGPDDVTAVLLGNSRLRHAVTFGFDPEKPLTLPDGRNLWAAQFAQDVAMFEAYEQLWPAIIAAKPDYIIVQDALLTTDRLVDIMSLAGFSNVIYNQIEKRLLGRDPETEWKKDRADIIDTCIRPEDYNSAEMQDRLIFAAYRDRHALGGANANTDKARKAIERALDSGIRVFVLRLPSNETMVARFDVPLDKIDFYGMGYIPAHEQLLPGSYKRVQWLEYPAPGGESFCDFVHFNQKGRADFSAALLQLLK